MKTTNHICETVGEAEIQDKQYVSAAMKYSANKQGPCHISVQSKTEAVGPILWFINDCSCLVENESGIQYSALPDEAVQ